MLSFAMLLLEIVLSKSIFVRAIIAIVDFKNSHLSTVFTRSRKRKGYRRIVLVVPALSHKRSHISTDRAHSFHLTAHILLLSFSFMILRPRDTVSFSPNSAQGSLNFF